MKHQMMINIAAVTGLVLGPLNASAAGFGGGWMLDKDTGTLYNSNAPTAERHQAEAGKQHGKRQLNSFGGNWVQDKNTGTLFNSRAPSFGQGQASAS